MTPAERDAYDHIVRLKAQYCHYVDTKQWDALREIFTPDAELHKTSDGATSVMRTRDVIVARLSTNLATVPTLHYATNPLVTYVAADHVDATWCALYMSGIGPEGTTGHGWYDETYRNDNGTWRIAKLHLRVNFMR